MKDIERTHIRCMVRDFIDQLNGDLSLLINEQYNLNIWRRLNIELQEKISSTLFYYVQSEIDD